MFRVTSLIRYITQRTPTFSPFTYTRSIHLLIVYHQPWLTSQTSTLISIVRQPPIRPISHTRHFLPARIPLSAIPPGLLTHRLAIRTQQALQFTQPPRRLVSQRSWRPRAYPLLGQTHSRPRARVGPNVSRMSRKRIGSTRNVWRTNTPSEREEPRERMARKQLY